MTSPLTLELRSLDARYAEVMRVLFPIPKSDGKSRMFTCTTCNKELPEDAFHAELRIPKGRAGSCRLCIKEIRRGRHRAGGSACRDPIKNKARGKLRDAVRYGKIQKPSNCEQCGATTEPRLLDGHHHDYSKPLDVRWLCRSCHGFEALGSDLKDQSLNSFDGGVEGHASRAPRMNARKLESAANATAPISESLEADQCPTGGIKPAPSDPSEQKAA